MHASGLRPPGRRARPSSRRLAGLALAGPALAGLVVWEGTQERYSTASHASVLAVIGAVLVLALFAGSGRQHDTSRAWVRALFRAPRTLLVSGRDTSPAAGAIVWVLLIASTIAWDMVSFALQRHSLPTLSRLFGDVTDHGWGRALVFAAWLLLGLYLATAWRLPQGWARTGRRRAGGIAGESQPPSRPAGEDGDT